MCAHCKTNPRTTYTSRCKECNAAYQRGYAKKKRGDIPPRPATPPPPRPYFINCRRCRTQPRIEGKHFCEQCNRLCSTCRTNRRAFGSRYCAECRNAHARRTRKNWNKTEEARMKENCRSYANVYLKRGKLVKQPCEVCGSPESQMHHDDYSKPLEVRWLCRRHHLYHHEDERKAAKGAG